MFKFVWLFLLVSYSYCRSHSNKIKGFKEKVENSIFSSRDSEHYKDGKHNHEFDHEAVLGSHDAAEEFDHLPPEEAKSRLKVIALKMDSNKDGYVDRKELIAWVLNSFKMLTEEEALDEFEEEDTNEDDKVTWEEHVAETYGFYDENKFANIPEESEMFENDMELFKYADLNGDGVLHKSEFPAFSHPEEFDYMHEPVYRQTMKRKDKNNDGFLDFDEFIADSYGSAPLPSTEHYVMEKDKFNNDYDLDGNKKLSKDEVLNWLIPNNVETAENEAQHLIESTDSDNDGKLSLSEIIDHYDVFVGSEATDYGEHLYNYHKFSDEL